jgi:ParB family transcriptional regulator, chromosome partitioning protein
MQLGLLSSSSPAAAVVATKQKQHFDAGESSEWYTPAPYIEAARAAMGAIDLDPASCSLANEVVRATRFFERANNGLQQHWTGRVWLNPPYSDYAGQAASWAAKLLAEYEAGRVSQAIMLVNLSTSYQPAMQQLAGAGMVCMVAHRIRFYTPQGQAERPTQANVIFYLGERRQSFAEHFGQFGAVLAPYEQQKN